MEQKNTMKNNNLNLLIYNLNEKKNWFLVSVAIMIITLVIMPVILGSGINQNIIIVGMLEIATLLFLNALIDFSYLHDNRKLTYYVSKPSTRMERVNSLIVSNIMFLTVLLMLLTAIAVLSGGVTSKNLFDVYTPAVPWLIIGVFFVALSSLLTGNTIAAGMASVINFTLPLSSMAIIYYGFEVVGHFAKGFNPSILFNSFIDNFYRVDILYFVKYLNNNFSWDYFLVLALWLIILYSLIVYVAKRRKNEKTGEFVVSEGYKNMISLLLASLVPIGFSEVFYNTSIASRIISFIILSGLTYYLINAILEKSFKISRFAMKLFVIFICAFGLFIAGTNIVAGSFESKVPQAEEVRAVYFDTSNYVWSENYENTWNLHNVKEEDIDKSPYAVLFKDKDNIQGIIDFHKAVIENQDYYNYSSFNIVYFYENGDRLYRYYKLEENESYGGEKDLYLKGVVTSSEFKNKKLPFVYDDDYFAALDILDINIQFETGDYYSQGAGIKRDDLDLDILRIKMKNDYNRVLEDSKYQLNFMLMDRYGYSIDRYNYDKPGASRPDSFYINVNHKRGELRKDEYFSFRITKDFRETFEYLSILRDGDLEKLESIVESVLSNGNFNEIEEKML